MPTWLEIHLVLRRRSPHGTFLKKKQKKRERGSTSPQQPVGVSQGGFHSPRPDEDGTNDRRRCFDPQGWIDARIWTGFNGAFVVIVVLEIELRPRQQPATGSGLR